MNKMPPARTAQIAPPPSNQNSVNKVTFAPIKRKGGHRTVLYGPGGIGKTTLACMAEGPVAFVDADESLDVLSSQLEEQGIALPSLVNASDWKSLRSSLQSDGWNDVKTIVLDTATKIEEWCVAHTLATVKHEKGHKLERIEDYGFGKGFQHVYDTFLPLLSDLDRHVRAGRNVILIAHECVSNVPNPNGEDWIRYEPRLQNPSSGKASIRLRLKEWADHVLFLGYDVAVGSDKKAKGQGTRTLYTSELPFCMAKSRTTNSQIDIVHGTSPWANILK